MPASDRPAKPTPIGWEALRANSRPGVVVQVLMLLVVIGYYRNPQVAAVLGWLAEYKHAHGIWFVVGSTVLAAAILPELLLVLFFQGGRVRPENFRNILFTAPLWAVDGITVDLLYRWLAQVVGDEVSLSVVATKICIDQFGYSVLFAAPYGVIAYEWKNSGFSFAVLRRCFTFRYYRDKIVPTLFTIWAVWIPLVAMIYSLPLPVQFPLFSLALTFWVLLFTYMTNRFAGKDGLPADFATGDLAAQSR
ncbi:MAG: hypothetical protein H0T11_06430 [Chthoniobacterales bacterium]|nr:hypothetical protein [Chthoniobacterales bacterium]